jgi:hypothetical protein
MNLPLVLIHGYSDQGASFRAWRDKLTKGEPARGTDTISTCSYQSLTDEVTIKDLADGLDRALRVRFGNDGQAFDAIVHSTGMLVIREWFARDRRRLGRLKHLIAIAPATFGSPLARQGRSWLGAIFKGQKHLGPDFLAAGDAILDGLELASPYTWDLAGRDIFNEKPFFDDSPDTPSDYRLVCRMAFSLSTAAGVQDIDFVRLAARPGATPGPPTGAGGETMLETLPRPARGHDFDPALAGALAQASAAIAIITRRSCDPWIMRLDPPVRLHFDHFGSPPARANNLIRGIADLIHDALRTGPLGYLGRSCSRKYEPAATAVRNAWSTSAASPVQLDRRHGATSAT